MNIKKITGIAAVSILIIVWSGILGYSMAYARIAEEYIDVFTENKDDFEYVAQIMKQCKKNSCIAFDYSGCYMDFYDCVSSNNPELESEMSKNKKFYECLKNIFELNEIKNISVLVYSYSIEFSFRRHLRGQIDGIIYGEDIKKCYCTHIIEENWALEMRPYGGHHHVADIWEEWLEYFKW